MFESPEKKEQHPLPELKTGQEVADMTERLHELCSPLFGQHLAESNIVLTLAALKAQTEFFIETRSDEEAEQVQADIDTLNEYLDSKNTGIRFKNAGPTTTDTEPGVTTLMIGAFNLDGYDRISHTTKLPGVEPYDRNDGWDAFNEWALAVEAKVKQAQADGKIPAELNATYILDGVVRGYPDQACYDFADSFNTGRGQEMQDSHIAHVGTYQEAQPNYDFYPEHADNPAIKENIAQASQILTDFYASEWHQEYKAKQE